MAAIFFRAVQGGVVGKGLSFTGMKENLNIYMYKTILYAKTLVHGAWQKEFGFLVP